MADPEPAPPPSPDPPPPRVRVVPTETVRTFLPPEPLPAPPTPSTSAPPAAGPAPRAPPPPPPPVLNPYPYGTPPSWKGPAPPPPPQGQVGPDFLRPVQYSTTFYGVPGSYGYPQPIYGYGPGYAPQPAWPPPGHHTAKGLRTLKAATAAVMVYGVFSIISNFVILSGVGQMQRAVNMGSIEALDNALTTVTIGAAILAIGGLVGICGVIAGFVGMGNLYRERGAYGEAHKRSVQGGVALAGLAIVFYLLQVVTTVVGNSGVENLMASNDLASLDRGLNLLFATYVLESALAMLGAFASGAAMYKVVGGILPAKGRGRKGSFLALSFIGPILNLIVALAMPGMVGSLADAGDPSALMAAAQSLVTALYWMTWGAILASFLGLIGLGIYRAMLDDASRGSANMMRSGLFDPDASSSSVFGAAPYAPTPSAFGPQRPY